MAVKISMVLCTLVLLLVGAIGQQMRECRSRYERVDPETSYYHSYCDVLASEVEEQTWYQEEAFIKVVDGTLTVELLSNDSSPSSLLAEGKGVVRLHRGFARIPSLKWLSLEENSIERIESSVFDGLPEITYLNLARNRISYIDIDGFQGLTQLEVLILNHNNLKGELSHAINDDALPALKRLYLQHNQLESVNNYNQEKSLCNSSLELLYLSNNSLRSFDLNVDYYDFGFPCLRRLTHLFLEDNNLGRFDVGESPLESLSLDGNYIHEAPNITPQLKFLSLARNRIRYLPSISNGENLVRLVLSYNMISTSSSWLPRNFQNLSSLEHLALDHNWLESLHDGMFRNLTSLRSLYLVRNKIKDISPQAFKNLPALRELSFDNNYLTSFPGEKSFGESNLSYLDLSNNKVENISDLQANMIPKLKVLKLTGNPLKRMDPNSVSSDVTILF